MTTRSAIFLGIMIAIAAAALVAFAAFLVVKASRNARAAPAAGAAPGTPASSTAAPSTTAPGTAAPSIAAPAAVRLLGLLALLAAVLVLDWTFLDGGTAYALMLYVVYPAAFATALVLLFDKATRSWSHKSSLAGTREWFFCDTIAFLLLLAYLNLWMSGAGAKYVAFFWDVLGLLLAFGVFWLIDRKFTRYRFLVAYGYLVLLPILLLIWTAVQDVPARLGADQRLAQALELAAAKQEEAAREREAGAPKPAAPESPALREGEKAAGAGGGGQDAAAAKEPSGQAESATVREPPPWSWWKTIWPFFAWAAAFFVLETIGLIAFEESDRSLVLLLKDVAFVAGYAVLLLIAAR
jgi:hypothetical protein